MELFNGAERMHSVRGGDAGALGSPQLLLLSGPPLIVGNSRGSSLMSCSSSSMITHEISLMFPSSRSTPQHRVVEYRVSGSGFTTYAILGSDIVIGDAEVAAIKLNCFPLGYRDFESRTLKPFPFGRALNQPGLIKVVQWFNDFEFRSAIESVDSLNPESKSSRGGELGRAKPEANDAHSSYESSPCR
ncbi:hypothetical protein V6N13_098942 [Hibiscus sabdariffa]